MHFLIPGGFEGLKIDSVYGAVQGSAALRTSASHTRAFTVRRDVIQTAQTHTDTQSERLFCFQYMLVFRLYGSTSLLSIMSLVVRLMKDTKSLY